MPPTIRDVAARAGVAPSSVTRVLGGYPNVTPNLRERVLAAVEEVGYRPDLLAAGLRRGYTKTVGMIVNDVLNPVVAQIIDTVESELRDAGYGVILTNSNGRSDTDIDNLLLLQQRRVDALIASIADDRNPAMVAALANASVPVVLLDREIDSYDLSAVVSDHRYGARLLTEHLIDQGHTEIAIVSGSLAAYPSRERVQGVLEAMRARRIPVRDGFQLSGRGSVEFGADSTAALLDAPTPPSALIIGNGNTAAAAGVLGELRRRGVRVGVDLAVAVAEDGPLASLYTPALTVLQRDIAELARRGARMVLARLTDPKRPPHSMSLPVHLVVRESTDWVYTPRS